MHENDKLFCNNPASMFSYQRTLRTLKESTLKSRILVVNDTQEILELFRMLLEEEEG